MPLDTGGADLRKQQPPRGNSSSQVLCGLPWQKVRLASETPETWCRLLGHPCQRSGQLAPPLRPLTPPLGSVIFHFSHSCIRPDCYNKQTPCPITLTAAQLPSPNPDGCTRATSVSPKGSLALTLSKFHKNRTERWTPRASPTLLHVATRCLSLTALSSSTPHCMPFLWKYHTQIGKRAILSVFVCL